jgi:hypothetical protein
VLFLLLFGGQRCAGAVTVTIELSFFGIYTATAVTLQGLFAEDNVIRWQALTEHFAVSCVSVGLQS